jgi:RNA polymerase sigma-70 factor (sigma-E family)
MGTPIVGLRWAPRADTPYPSRRRDGPRPAPAEPTEPPEPPARASADEGIERLFRTHRLTMVRLAALLVDDLESAEDVVQDAFAGLHRRWSALQNDAVAVGYLRTSVVNGARSTLRRRRTARNYTPHPLDWTSMESADGPVLLAEDHREVLAAIRRLPPRQREVIVLRYWAELTEPKIAQTLGISIGSVKSAASRGRNAIAAILEGQLS